jgi:hypothetical protein
VKISSIGNRNIAIQAAQEDKEVEAQTLENQVSKKMEEYIQVPGLGNKGLNEIIRPSVTDRARTITHVCTSGTLCTTSKMDEIQGSPFGSYVDYILDMNGWPVMLLSVIEKGVRVDASLGNFNAKICANSLHKL